MTVSALPNRSAFPYADDTYVFGNSSGTANLISPGDYIKYSGNYIVATHDGDADFKASGVGVAVDRNPAYDPWGRQVINSALTVAVRGLFIFSATFSGQPKLGLPVFPDTTGSAAWGPSGASGVAAGWGTANPVNVSGATAAAPSKAVGQLIGWYNPGNAGGTGQLAIRLWSRTSDYY